MPNYVTNLCHYSPDPVLHHGCLEVQQQAHSQFEHSQIGNHLRRVYGLQVLHTLHLDNDTIRDNKVGPVFGDESSFVVKRHTVLSPEREAGFLQFHAECRLVD